MPGELQIGLALISTATVVGGFVFAAYQFENSRVRGDRGGPSPP